MSNRILVIGATGNVGHTLVRLLAKAGADVIAATRQPDAYQGPAGVPVRMFDYDRPESYASAVDGVDRMFVIAKNADANADLTVDPLVSAAKSAGVRHAVLMTAMGVEVAEGTGIRKAELHLIGSGLDYTILRPTWFMQNFSVGFILPMIQQAGTIFLPAGEGRSSFIDTDDIAAVAARTLTEEGHAGKEYALTGSEALTYGEAAAMLSEATGRQIGYAAIEDGQFRASLSSAGWHPDQVDMMAGLFYAVREGWAIVISPTVPELLGRAPTKFRAFARANAAIWQ